MSKSLKGNFKTGRENLNIDWILIRGEAAKLLSGL